MYNLYMKKSAQKKSYTIYAFQYPILLLIAVLFVATVNGSKAMNSQESSGVLYCVVPDINIFKIHIGEVFIDGFDQCCLSTLPGAGKCNYREFIPQLIDYLS